jgi:DNA-binding PadR family transcriptional regulator
MAMVPKGFLRHQVLKLLSEKPMSGSEIISEIERQTNGQWRPSHGSIYPLLSSLKKKGFIKEEAVEAGMKRYALMEQGKVLLEDLTAIKIAIIERLSHLNISHLMEAPWLEIFSGKYTGIFIATRKLAEELFSLLVRLRQEYSEEAAEEARKTLEEAAMKIADIVKKPTEKVSEAYERQYVNCESGKNGHTPTQVYSSQGD